MKNGSIGPTPSQIFSQTLRVGVVVASLSACSAPEYTGQNANDPIASGQLKYGPSGQGQRSASVHTITDPLAPNGSSAAVDVAPPPGWQIQSAVRWDNSNGQCSAKMVSPVFRATSPDGKRAIEQFPGFLVTTSEQDIRRRGSSPGDFCVLGMADSGAALAEQFAVPFLRPQSRITGIRNVALDPAIAAMQARLDAMRAASSINASLYTVEVTLENDDGSMEKIVLGGMIVAGQQMMPGVPPLVLNQNLIAYGVRAPAAQMAETEALAAQVRASVRPHPEWQAAVDAHTNRMTKPVFTQPGGERGGNGTGMAGSGPYTGGGTGSTGSSNGGINSDESQRKRIDTIYEQERCADGRVVSIHAGC